MVAGSHLMSARDEILSAITSARVGSAHPVVRSYRASLAPGHPGVDDPATLFAERVADYRAVVTRVDPAAAGRVIAERVLARGRRTVLLPAGFPPGVAEALASDTRVDIRRSDADAATISGNDSVVTTCAVAIALTGTVVLDGGPGQGRRLESLLPDHHVVLVRTEQIVGSVPEAVALLDPLRPLTWISGPSATSDIELSRVEGVHGPRHLDVIILDSAVTPGTRQRDS
jgi:L-lactate dehydrogenase complex protein LldG